jgi:hypothetical protein
MIEGGFAQDRAAAITGAEKQDVDESTFQVGGWEA